MLKLQETGEEDITTNTLEQNKLWISSDVNEILKLNEEFKNFLKILETYKLKWVARNSSNFYYDSKENINYKRKETTAEHVYSCLKLADFFLITEEEFADLDRLKIYELLMYHDDVEIETEDTCISQREEREKKKVEELLAVPILAKKYPNKLWNKFMIMDNEYRENITKESQFVHSIDKMDALIHEVSYPQDWGPKWFDEKNVRKWFQSSFKNSPTFIRYFENLIDYLNKNGYF